MTKVTHTIHSLLLTLSLVESTVYVWRETLGDGFIAVRSFQNEVREKKQKDLKDERFDFDKVVSENLVAQTDKFLPKSVVYHE